MSFTIFQNEKTPFCALKTRSRKSRKIDILPKGLSHGFGPKMVIFSTFLFSQFRPGKCLLRYSRTKKTALYAIKTNSAKNGKIGIFPKGLTHGFGPKMANFPTFFFKQFRKGKYLAPYSREKKLLFTLLKEEVQKVEKLAFFPRG